MDLAKRIIEDMQQASESNSAELMGDLDSKVQHLDQLGTSWMSKLRPTIGDRTLRDICVPRSHDAAMYQVTNFRRLGSKSTIITHTKDILTQLNLGVRMFDIRPCIVKGQFFCGHYQYIKESDVPSFAKPFLNIISFELTGYYHGGEGAPLSNVIDQINEFTGRNNEVVMLQMSHAMNFDREERGSEWGLEFNQSEWDRLLTELRRLNHLHMSSGGGNAEITKVKINDLIADHSAVIVTTQPAGGINLGEEFAGKGFFESGVLAPLHQTDITHVQETVEAIAAYLQDKGPPLSATLFANFLGKNSRFLNDGLYDIISVARLLQREELPKVIARASQGNYTNIISVDNAENGEPLSAAFRVLGRAITGQDVVLSLSNDNQWSFVPI